MLRGKGTKQGCTYMCGDVVCDEMFQKTSIVVGQKVFHHGEHIKRRVGEVLEPVGTPVCWNRIAQGVTEGKVGGGIVVSREVV